MTAGGLFEVDTLLRIPVPGTKRSFNELAGSKGR